MKMNLLADQRLVLTQRQKVINSEMTYIALSHFFGGEGGRGERGGRKIETSLP